MLKSMDRLLQTIEKSFYNILTILFILITFIIIFAILGVNLFRGELNHRCRFNEMPFSNGT